MLDRSRADQRWAVSAALQSTDLPGGWNVWTAPHNLSTSELVLACKRFVLDLSHTRVTGIRASSYVVPAHTQVSHLVASFATARDAGRLASADLVPFYQRCLRTEIGEMLASSAKVQSSPAVRSTCRRRRSASPTGRRSGSHPACTSSPTTCCRGVAGALRC